MGCMFQDTDVTSRFGLQSSKMIFFFGISPHCDPRGLCQEDVPGFNPLVELLKLTDPLGKRGKVARGLFCKSLASGVELP